MPVMLFALAALVVMAAGSIAQEAEQGAAPPAGEAQAPPAEPAQPEAVAPEAPAPATEPTPTDVAGDVADGAGPAPTDGTTPAPESPPADPQAPPATVPDEGIVIEPTPPPVSAGGGGSSAGKGSRPKATHLGTLTREEDYQEIQERCANRDSERCWAFLYPQCNEASREYDSNFCALSVRSNPCYVNTRSNECRLFAVSSCFTEGRLEVGICYFIREAFFSGRWAEDDQGNPDPNNPFYNPCRDEQRYGPNSAECQRYASQEECDRRDLRGVDCELFRLFRSYFTSERARECLAQHNGTVDEEPDPLSPCGVLTAILRRACNFYPPAFGCYPMEFSTTEDETSSDLNLGSQTDEDDDTPASGRDRADSFRSAISDPGGEGERGDTEPASSRGEGRRRRPLSRTGADLEMALLLGLGMFGLGVVLRRRNIRMRAS